MNTEAEFKKELQDLLRKYNVEISIEGDRDGYAEINFYRWPEYDTDGNESSEQINWNTRWMNGDIM